MFGLTDTRNTVHGSDCEENAHKEILFYFPNFDEAEWRENYESFFNQKNRLFFDGDSNTSIPSIKTATSSDNQRN